MQRLPVVEVGLGLHRLFVLVEGVLNKVVRVRQLDDHVLFVENQLASLRLLVFVTELGDCQLNVLVELVLDLLVADRLVLISVEPVNDELDLVAGLFSESLHMVQQSLTEVKVATHVGRGRGDVVDKFLELQVPPKVLCLLLLVALLDPLHRQVIDRLDDRVALMLRQRALLHLRFGLLDGSFDFLSVPILKRLQGQFVFVLDLIFFVAGSALKFLVFVISLNVVSLVEILEDVGAIVLGVQVVKSFGLLEGFV